MSAPSDTDCLEFEFIVLGMLLRSPKTMLQRVYGDLFAWPGNRAVFDAVQRLADRDARITVESVRMESGDQAHNVPTEAWFTIANASFYIHGLERRNARKRRRAELLDELNALDKGIETDQLVG